MSVVRPRDDIPRDSAPPRREAAKRAAARAALEYVRPGEVIGVGSGTTAWAFVEALAEARVAPGAALAASIETARRLVAIGVAVLDDEQTTPLELYVDGADLITREGVAIKGGGAAHTREKTLATSATTWVCVVDDSKLADSFEGASIPLEVHASALGSVAEQIARMGGSAVVREDVLTDAGNPVIDAQGLALADPLAVERALDAIPGVVGNGLFARRRADVILVGSDGGSVERIVPAEARA